MKRRVLSFLDLAIEYLIYGLILFIPISIAGVGIFAGAATLLFLIKQILSPDFSTIRSNKIFFLILLVFFVFMALSLLNSGPLLGKSLKALLLKWGRFPLILWMILDTFRDTRRMVNAVWVLSFSAALVGCTALSQKFFHVEFLRNRPFIDTAIMGPFENRNNLAAYLTGVVPVILSFGLWKWRRVAVKAGLFLLVLLLIAASSWTLCRGAWVGLAAGLILLALFVNYNRLSRKIFWTLFLGGYVFCLPFLAMLLTFFQNRGDGERFGLISIAWKMIQEHPFLGKGLGTFADYSVTYASNFVVFYAHNCFLQIWAESGIFSLVSFLFLVGYVFYNSVKVVLRGPLSLNVYILIGLCSSLLGFLVHSFFDTQLYSFQLSFLFWVMLALTIAMHSNLKENLAL